MMNRLRPPRGLCLSCIRRVARGPQRRWLSVAAEPLRSDNGRVAPVVNDATRIYHDDAMLRQIFDSPPAWVDFSKASSKAKVGLFQNAYLTGPDGFKHFANASLKRARRIVDKVLEASSVEEYRAVVRQLDRLSDLLCRVLDLSDFVRVTHPDLKIQQAASRAWDRVYKYMNELNTMTGLHEQLKRAMKNPDVTAAWSEEEMTVAQVLELDFSKSAVNLPAESRERFVQLSSDISTVSSLFVDKMRPAQQYVKLPSSKLMGMDPVSARRLTRRGSVLIPTLSSEAALALRNVHDADARKEIYYATRTASDETVRILEVLMQMRSNLAHLSGFENYGQMALRDRMMARSPQSVKEFLGALGKNNTPIVKQEMADLLAEKRKDHPEATSLEPWDKDYYADRIRRSITGPARKADFLSAYFSLGTVMQGLSRIFSRLYGIRFVPRETLPGETWHPDVRRLDVVSDTDGHVAVLYCDLFYREDKSPNPAHFTVRCSRQILEDEVREAELELSDEETPRPDFTSLDSAANDGMALSRHGGVLKQLPTIALICDFQKDGSAPLEPALLGFFQLETLFHEMGHAIHSILARTSFQNVSGTRCATDLAELPSTLMEYFAADPTVLALFARHYQTDDPLRYELVAERLRVARRFEGADTENQLVLAMLDQELHSSLAASPTLDSTAIFHGVQAAYGNTPRDPPTTKWQGFFGHLSGYGSTYYSYLFDRVLAERVWKIAFSSGRDGAALERKNGERLKEDLLKWGGSRDPWRCLAGVLQDGSLADGGEQAMKVVGSWGMSSKHVRK